MKANLITTNIHRQAEIDRIKDVPGFSNKDQRSAYSAGPTVGREAAPMGGGSPSVSQRSSSSHDQTIYVLISGNRRGVEVTPGKAHFNGSPDIPEELKSKVKALYARDNDYREHRL